jgi:hypothetical protein
MAVSQEDVDEWVQTAGRLRYDIINFDSGDEHAAREAIANFLSEYGYDIEPQAVVEMFGQLLEVGYLTALRAVREGWFDAEIEMWRPDLCG